MSNPLVKYYRSIKLFVTLPSGKNYYPDNVIDVLEDGTVGIQAMTGKDELILKNPDALLNGEALVEVIKSCVPGVKNVKALLSNDIDALITAIRCATYDDTLETELLCPSCEHKASYKLDLHYAIDNISILESEYVVNLDNGLSIFIKPYSYPDVLKGLHSQFEQSKITRSLENVEMSEEQKLSIFSTVFKNVAKLTQDLTVSSIIKVVNEDENILVTDKKQIAEFIDNIDRNSMLQIEDMIKEVNKVGIKRSFTACCEKCNHEWENSIDFNPVNFS
jgi:hypothetical protein